MGYMNEFPHSRMFDSDLREILDMYNSLKDLPDKFSDLKDYVTNYFKNLNIEDELDKKIEEAANSGELIAIIAPYLPFITPQMFGAIGDGLTDDTEAFNTALATNKTIYIPEGEYLLSDSLTLTQGATIIGIGDYIATTLTFSKGGLIFSDRWITVKNIALKSIDASKSSNGITFTRNEMTAHMCCCENIVMYDFNIGIEIDVVMWSSYFKNIRINTCNIGIKSNAIGATSFCVNFTNVYIANCEKTMELHTIKAVFISCNFSIMSPLAIVIDSSSNLSFIQCNFECDREVESGVLIFMGSYGIEFEGCTFILWGVEDTYMCGFQGTYSVKFRSCVVHLNGSSVLGNFFSANTLNVPIYGAIELDSLEGSFQITPLYSHQIPYFINRGENKTIEFYPTSVDLNKCKNGMIMYNLTTNKLCYYNGTNIVDTDGAIVV